MTLSSADRSPRNTAKIAFVGMTHLGLCSAAASASKGFITRGFDQDVALVARLSERKLPVSEPGLDDILRENASRISFVSESKELAECDVVYVAPDVPTDDRNQSDLTVVDALLEFVLDHTGADSTVVLLSQVPPGFTRKHQRRGRALYYQVETLVFGRAVERATLPERFIVGCADPNVPLPPVFAAYLASYGCPILPMRLESAELAKISINCYLVSSISVANTLAELCEQIGADWSEIAPALKLDRRIGPYAYLAPGLGIAGGNLERDLSTICQLADRAGTDASIVRAWVAHSQYRKDWALRMLHREVLGKVENPALAILGLAYKEDTQSTKNSPSLALIQHLSPYRLTVYDPLVPASAAPHPNVAAAASPIDACRGADAVLIMTPWPQFRALDPAAIGGTMRGRTVIDPFCVLDPSAVHAAGLRHITLGVSTRTC
jgi:UDPglucose 6-dehydrogenase